MAVVIGAAGAIAACGSTTKHTSTSSATVSPSTSGSASTSSTVSTASTTATTSAQPPEVPKGRRSQRAKHPTVSSGAHIPAQFAISASGAVTPPLISAPPGVTIALSVRNEGAQSRTVHLDGPHPMTIAVPAHGSKTADVVGLPKGTYAMTVDGAPRAKLSIGAVPGP